MKNWPLTSLGAYAVTGMLCFPCVADDSILPPLTAWQGNSEQLIQHHPNEWQTPAERSGLTDTPDYQTTLSFINKLVQAEPMFELVTLGKSPQQRDIVLVIASTEGANSPEQLQQNGKPTLFIQAGIHAGEIDGKDAGLMLLRDISKRNKQHLLDKVNIVFLPIFNVDGHERRSAFNRVNQRGPVNMGWRTTAQNLNLNRDYAKADAPEMQLLLGAINDWQPDLYFDIHVTDGEDYQYDITYGFNAEHGNSPHISQWLTSQFSPKINASLAANGHKGGQLVFGINAQQFSDGILGWFADPRFSNGWGDMRQLPTVLIENHSLKPYRQRVLGTYVLLESTLTLLAEQGQQLKQATKQDRLLRPKQITLAWQTNQNQPKHIEFAGIDYQTQTDLSTGINYSHWNGTPKTYSKLAVFEQNKAKLTVAMPKAFYLPVEQQTVLERLLLQGIEVSYLAEAEQQQLSQFIAKEPNFANTPFEGHLTVSAQFDIHNIEITLAKGMAKISTDQDLGRLAVALLDPRAPDSFFSWGFFNQMFQRTEYIEAYVMVPLAKKLFSEQPELLKQFYLAFPEAKTMASHGVQITEHENSMNGLFSAQPEQKMQWLYQHSPFYDQHYLKYPVLVAY